MVTLSLDRPQGDAAVARNHRLSEFVVRTDFVFALTAVATLFYLSGVWLVLLLPAAPIIGGLLSLIFWRQVAKVISIRWIGAHHASSPLPKDFRSRVKEKITVPGNVYFLRGQDHMIQSASLGIIHFIIVPAGWENQLNVSQISHVLEHEIAHQKYADFSAHQLNMVLFALIGFVAFLYFFDTREIGDAFRADVDAGLFSSEVPMVLPLLVLCYVSAINLLNSIHIREHHADFAALTKVGDQYLETLRRKERIARSSASPMWLPSITNQLTHPSFSRRVNVATGQSILRSEYLQSRIIILIVCAIYNLTGLGFGLGSLFITHNVFFGAVTSLLCGYCLLLINRSINDVMALAEFSYGNDVWALASGVFHGSLIVPLIVGYYATSSGPLTPHGYDRPIDLFEFCALAVCFAAVVSVIVTSSYLRRKGRRQLLAAPVAIVVVQLASFSIIVVSMFAVQDGQFLLLALAVIVILLFGLALCFGIEWLFRQLSRLLSVMR